MFFYPKLFFDVIGYESKSRQQRRQTLIVYVVMGKEWALTQVCCKRVMQSALHGPTGSCFRATLFLSMRVYCYFIIDDL